MMTTMERICRRGNLPLRILITVFVVLAGAFIDIPLAALRLRVPPDLLLDEPFSALDIRTQVQIRRGLKEILAAARIPAILVTHDLRDAVVPGDWICLMEQGKIVLCGNADTILQKGQHPFVDPFFFRGVS